MDETTGGQFVPCPVCGGSGWLKLLDRYMPTICCRFCEGSGRITEEQKGWWSTGRLLRDMRRGLRLRTHETAAWLEISPSQLADAEQGVVDPAEVGYTIETLALCARKSD